LYLQEPEELKGDVFTGEFTTTPIDAVDPSQFERLVCYIDRAATEQRTGTDPDYTSILLMAQQKDSTYLVLYVNRFRATPAMNESKIKHTIQELTQKYKGIEIFIEQEPGSSGKDSIHHYKNRVLNGYHVRGDRPTGSKHIRSIDVAAAVEQGKVRFVEAKWNGPLFLEMRAFPYGSHDDMVDTLSGAYNKLRKRTTLKPRKRRRRR